MSKTSVHLKACNVGSSQAHNEREKELDYVRADLSHLNESFSYIDHSLQTEVANIKKRVKEKTGRKMQKNAIPVKEGVVVIDESTTMDDLKRLCAAFKERFNLTPLQIHIHRDEGHAAAKEWIPNLHAHIVWSMYDENGRNVRAGRTGAEMQTIAANILRMERGKSSDRKHLEALQYKIQEQEKILKQKDEQIKELMGKITEKEDSLRLVKAIETFAGPTLPQEPKESATEQEWRKYYQKHEDIAQIYISDAAEVRTRSGSAALSVQFAGGGGGIMELGGSESSHLRMGWATHLQMAAVKCRDFIRQKAQIAWANISSYIPKRANRRPDSLSL